MIPDLANIHARIAEEAGLPDTVHCRTCDWEQTVDPGHCLAYGWPKCCGQTMSLGNRNPDAAVSGDRGATVSPDKLVESGELEITMKYTPDEPLPSYLPGVFCRNCQYYPEQGGGPHCGRCEDHSHFVVAAHLADSRKMVKTATKICPKSKKEKTYYDCTVCSDGEKVLSGMFMKCNYALPSYLPGENCRVPLIHSATHLVIGGIVLGSLLKPVPQPIDWQPGWLVWHTYLEMLIKLGPVLRDEQFSFTHDGRDWETNPMHLSRPTRSQLAAPIPGSNPPVQAWAWEDDNGIRYECSDVVYEDAEYIRKDFALTLGLNIVPADQVAAMYATFPPEGEA